MSTKAKKKKQGKETPPVEKPAPFTAPADWWKKDLSNPQVFAQEYGHAEDLFTELATLREKEAKKQRDIEEANQSLEVLAQELQDREDERKRLWGDRYPLVFGQKPNETESEARDRMEGRSRKRGRPPGSKNKPKQLA